MHYCLRLPSLAAKDLKEFVKTGCWEEAREFLNDRTEGCTDQAGDKQYTQPTDGRQQIEKYATDQAHGTVQLSYLV